MRPVVSRPTSMRSLRAVACLAATMAIGPVPGCARSSRFVPHEGAAARPAVPPESVDVARDFDDVGLDHDSLGTYRGRAPSLEEVLLAARRSCGAVGGDLLVLDERPQDHDGVWEVRATCVRRRAAD